jgi:hypothetical protein
VSHDALIELDEPEWTARQARHQERTEPWIAPRLERRRLGRTHPVDDFLFDYYPYSVGKLATWHPGHRFVLFGSVDPFLASPSYRREGAGATADLARLTAQQPRLRFAIDVLERTATRAPNLGCLGMHEWAMVYRLAPQEVRHSSHPLRLSPHEIADVVDEIGLRCTHIDAFRFFTPAAVPLNAHEPTRATQPDWEQPACLHANMDLYKYASWFSPFVGSDLVADCFDVARGARELDMSAAPYDLESLGYRPIRMETSEGRREYVRRQTAVAAQAAELRSELASALATLESTVLNQAQLE